MAAMPPMPGSDLSRALIADYEALHANVQQAGALTADFQQHRAGTSNELAELQLLFEKAQEDLGRLNHSIAQLRRERHQLANEAMRAMALERKLAEVTTERDRLRAEGAAMREGLMASGEESAKRKRETDAQVARMALEMDALRQRGQPPSRTTATCQGADMHAALAQISATLERLTTQFAEDRRARPAPGARVDPGEAAAIDIDFES